MTNTASASPVVAATGDAPAPSAETPVNELEYFQPGDDRAEVERRLQRIAYTRATGEVVVPVEALRAVLDGFDEAHVLTHWSPDEEKARSRTELRGIVIARGGGGLE